MCHTSALPNEQCLLSTRLTAQAGSVREQTGWVSEQHRMQLAGLRDACWPRAQPDARYEHVLSLIRADTFGWADFFEPLVHSISSGGDFYLLANDFVSYLEAQARVCDFSA